MSIEACFTTKKVTKKHIISLLRFNFNKTSRFRDKNRVYICMYIDECVDKSRFYNDKLSKIITFFYIELDLSLIAVKQKLAINNTQQFERFKIIATTHLSRWRRFELASYPMMFCISRPPEDSSVVSSLALLPELLDQVRETGRVILLLDSFSFSLLEFSPVLPTSAYSSELESSEEMPSSWPWSRGSGFRIDLGPSRSLDDGELRFFSAERTGESQLLTRDSSLDFRMPFLSKFCADDAASAGNKRIKWI